MISIYRPPSENSKYCVNSHTRMIGYFGKICDNHLMLGDFNLEPTDSAIMRFLDRNSNTNLIKTNTCFKATGSCIDLILTGNFPLGLLQNMKQELVITIIWYIEF